LTFDRADAMTAAMNAIDRLSLCAAAKAAKGMWWWRRSISGARH